MNSFVSRIFRMFKKRRELRHVHLHKTYIDKVISGAEFSVRDGEGHIRRSIAIHQLYWIGVVFALLVLVMLIRTGYLQVATGGEYTRISKNNSFDRIVVLPIRGSIYDRHGTPIAWNAGETGDAVPERKYPGPGFSSLLGFIRYPKRDASGGYYRQETEGSGGLEQKYDHLLAGGSGSIVLERDATGTGISELYIEEPTDGDDVVVSLDAGLQKLLYTTLEQVAEEREFQAGSGVVLDVQSGEVIALVSYPDFDNALLVSQTEKIPADYLQQQDEGVFVHRAVSGLYSPGSTIKPFFAAAALEEEIIAPNDIITSEGFITVQNPYDLDSTYTYKDWQVHGDLTIYDAIAQSSNVYFYYVGGGYGHIDEGLGIDRLNFYAEMFGFGRPTKVGVFHEPEGLLPNPKWKKERYDEGWTIGDTYNTVIGQYSFQVTPLQLVRAMAAIANGGLFLEPHLYTGKQSKKVRLAISEESLAIVRAGMRKTVTEGTAKILHTDTYTLAAKTGTAQVGITGLLDSLLIGFFPYEKPRYAFVIVMERSEQEAGALTVAKRFFNTLAQQHPHYLNLDGARSPEMSSFVTMP